MEQPRLHFPAAHPLTACGRRAVPGIGYKVQVSSSTHFLRPQEPAGVAHLEHPENNKPAVMLSYRKPARLSAVGLLMWRRDVES